MKAQGVSGQVDILILDGGSTDDSVDPDFYVFKGTFRFSEEGPVRELGFGCGVRQLNRPFNDCEL